MEALAEDACTVIADGAKAKQWASLRRVRGELGVSVSDAIRETVSNCVGSGRRFERSVHATRGHEQLLVRGIPVIGPSGVYGVQVLVGAGADVPPQRRVIAFDWDLDDKLLHVTEDAARELFGADGGATRSAPELFSRVEQFDDRLEYFAMLVDFAPEVTWQGVLAVRRFDGELRSYQVVARTVGDGLVRRVRNLAHDITDGVPPRPHLDLANVRAIAASSDGVGLVGLDYGVIYNWVSPPAAPLDRWVTERAEFDDPERFVTACRQLRDKAAEHRALRLRVRFEDSEWFDIDVTLTVATFGPPAQGVIQVRLSA